MDGIVVALVAVAAAAFVFATALAATVFCATVRRDDPHRALVRHIRNASLVSGAYILCTGLVYLAFAWGRPLWMEVAYRAALVFALLNGPAYIVLHHGLLGESDRARTWSPRLYSAAGLVGLLLVFSGPYAVFRDSGWTLYVGHPLPHFGLGLWIYGAAGAALAGYMVVQAFRIAVSKGGDRFWLVYALGLVIACAASAADMLRQFHAVPFGLPTMWIGLFLLQLTAFLLFVHEYVLMREEQRSLTVTVDRLRRLLIRDALTGLYSRAYLESVIRRFLARMRRGGRELGVVFLDVDHFKAVNDRFGHHYGDVVLKKLGGILRHTLREGDLPCRWAGDEFVVLLPDTGGVEGRRVAARLLRTIRETDFQLPDGAGITVSMGYTMIRSGAQLHWKDILELADRAMYRAKQRGRDRIVVSVVGKSVLPGKIRGWEAPGDLREG